MNTIWFCFTNNLYISTYMISFLFKHGPWFYPYVGMWKRGCWGRETTCLWWGYARISLAFIMGSCPLKTSRRCAAWDSNASM